MLDISERKEIENNLRYISEHDSLTGLHNRVYLEKTMKSDTMKKNDRKKAVVGINLSPVQSLTVTYGFHYTQDLIKKIADTLKRYSTDKYLLFNTYENRFVFYIKDYKDKDELLMLCKSIIIPLEALLSVERVSYGIGVVEIGPNNEMDVDQILKSF